MPRLRTCKGDCLVNHLHCETDSRSAAREVARSLARKAYRRPPSQAELDCPAGGVRPGKAKQSRLSGVPPIDAQGDPGFTPVPVYYAGRRAPPDAEIVPLDDYQLASRLSYLLWATMPDDELMALADSGKLHRAADSEGAGEALAGGSPLAGAVRWVWCAVAGT